MSKIFGEFTNMDDLNKTALNLREAGEKEEIILLGQENNIPEEVVSKFINKEVDYLVEIIDSMQQGKDITNENESSLEKLERELEECKTNSIPAAPIAKHLVSRCKQDELFSRRVLLTGKSLKDCFDYVYQEVKKRLDSVSGWVADEEVYKIAEDYFILDNIEIKSKAPETPKKKETVKELTQSTEIKDVKTKKDDNKNKMSKEKEILNVGQVSLFDF